MDMTTWVAQHPLLAALTSLILLVFSWLWKLNRAMSTVPDECTAAATGSPWTESVLRETYNRVSKDPIDSLSVLPPKLNRRYVVVGGSGLVGGWLVLQLLKQRHLPSAIRIIDFRPPARKDLVNGPAANVSFVQSDMTSEESMKTAFSQPWDASVASLPLTVFHTAAVIRPSERSPDVYDRCRIPNLVGTANVLSAAKAAGASIFILTSSCSIALKPVGWWTPWQFFPRNYAQTMTTDDFFEPIRPHGDFFSNYAASKGEAERLVSNADSKAEGFRTGAIRPGNGIYGSPEDLLVGTTLRLGNVPTFTAPWIQNWVHGANVAIAELQLEAALLGPHADSGIAGRPFLVTDPGPPISFRDSYAALELLSESPIKIHYPPPVLMLLVATGIEAWCTLLRSVPLLKTLGLKEPEPPLYFLQPACFDAAICSIIDDGDAKKSPEEGGLGYKGAFTTMEGVCMQLADWNRSLQYSEKISANRGNLKHALKAIPEPVVRKG